MKITNTILIHGKVYNSGFLVHTKEGQKILKRAREEKIATGKTNIFCICNGIDKPIPMHARKKPYGNGYTLGRDPHTKHLHNPDCIRYLEEVELKDREMMVKHDGNNGEETLSFLDNKNTSSHKKPVKHEHSNLHPLIEKILNLAWYKYVSNPNNKYNPKAGNLFHVIYNDLKDIKIHYSCDEFDINIELGKLLFKPYIIDKEEDVTDQLIKDRIHVIDNKIYKFNTLVIGKYIEHEQFNNLIKIKLFNPYLKCYYYIYSNQEDIRDKLSSKIDDTDLYIIAYTLPYDKFPITKNIDSVIVLENRGLYIKNHYELQFAKELLNRNILFTRPLSTDKTFKSFIPDFILLDRHSREFATVCKIFMYKSNSDDTKIVKYWVKAKKLISYYNTLKNQYNILYWYAGDGQKMPNIYEPKSKGSFEKQKKIK